MQQLYIYLHTHWDREWYLPFNHYRAFLLDRFRRTFAAIESGEVSNFYFDGQAVVFEDLIEVNPGFAPRIKNLMQKGLLSAGPWYVLPDQSLIGGESVIRNLKMGIGIVRKFGTPALTGYNPDTFCHVQDLPRILKGCGIDTAMVLRGVPEIGDYNTFWWESPDGSTVLTYWFNKGLSHTTFHNTGDVQKIADELSSWWQQDKLMLFSAGKDHTPAPGQFKRKLKELNKILPAGRKAVAVSMEEFLDDLHSWAKDKKLPQLTGDLRDNTNVAVSEWFPAYVLDGVSSTRLYLKRANALTEHRLIRIAEPLFSMLQAAGVMPYPQHELDYLWKLLLQNHPHDSICGCSVDPVHKEMMTRTQQINSFLNGLVDGIALNRLGDWNATQQVRKKVQPASMQQTASGLQVANGPQANDPASGCDRLLTFNTSCYPAAMPVKMTWYREPDVPGVKLSDNIQIDSDKLQPHYLFYSSDNIYYKPVRCVKGWVYPSGIVPGLGYREQQWHGGASLGKASTPASQPNAQLIKSARSDKHHVQISNGLISAEVDGEDNLVAVIQPGDKPRRIVLGHHLYDVGDGGDSYNFDPLPNDIPLKAELAGVKPGLQGPLVTSLILSYEIDIPDGLDTETNIPEPCDERRRSAKLLKHIINTEVSVRKGVPILFFKTNWENHSGDHRLEVRFNTQQTVSESIAECHFSTAKHLPVVKKMKLPVPVGKEAPPGSYFCQRFFIAGDQLFLNRGLPEYRIENNHATITLLRATSYLSRGQLRTRGGGAGPWTPTPEANCPGENCCEYGWAFIEKTDGSAVVASQKNSVSAASRKNDKRGGAAAATNQQIIRAYQLTDLFEGRLIPFVCGRFKGNSAQSLIEISNPALYVTACYVEQGNMMLRILNTVLEPQQSKVSIAFPVSKISKVNLLGEDSQASIPIKKEASGNSIIELKLQPNELLTLKLDLKTL